MNPVVWLRALASFGIGTLVVIVVSFFVGLEGLPKFELDANGQFEAPHSSDSDDEATDDPATTPEACDPAYVQVAVLRKNNQVDSDFATKYAEATADANNLSEAQAKLLLERSGHDAYTLAIWTHAFGLYKDPNDWTPLVDGACLSKEGEKLHNQFEGVLTARGTKLEEGQAPADGTNSGVNPDGVYGIEGAPGVRGDRKAIKITLPDGSVVWIMVRCGNPVFPGGHPSLPKVPTDNPPPPEEVPPGSGGGCENCLESKSTDRSDYRQPGDSGAGADVGTGAKPLAPAPEAPAEQAPPVVVEEQSGGNGVVDTPSNQPGSETGVTAPEADPPPADPPADPPPDEGDGVNDGTVTDGF